MKKEEIYAETAMTYDELVSYLLDKYGSAKYDYYYTPECKSKNKKITRTNEGLFCHHIDEDKGDDLGDPLSASTQPFEWQKKERLVYCNIIEHLILHIKIAILRQKCHFEKPFDIERLFRPGVIFISKDCNDMFFNNGDMAAWRKRCYEEIKDNYEDYIILLKAFLTYIDGDYQGEKNNSQLLKIGNFVTYDSRNGKIDGKITALSPLKDKFTLKLSSGKEETFTTPTISLSFYDFLDIKTRKLALGYYEFYEKIYNDILQCNIDLADSIANNFKIDYRGYGYAQYSHIILESNYGSKNADEYISKALPMYCDK